MSHDDYDGFWNWRDVPMALGFLLVVFGLIGIGFWLGSMS